jgi:hypothetical protein
MFALGVAGAYALVWMLRRFGLLSLLAAGAFSLISDAPAALPVLPATWYSGRVLFVLALYAAVPAWALWVIISAERRPRTASVDEPLNS